MNHHVMVDIETMGTEPGAALLSLAAVLFEPRGQRVEETFLRNIELQSCLDAGLRVGAPTVYWWLTRSDAARLALLKDRVPLSNALNDFSQWFKDTGASKIWSHGATFDVVIVETAYRALGLNPPYKFRDARDTRTLFDLARVEYTENEETAHQALADALRQAEFVQNAYRSIFDATS